MLEMGDLFLRMRARNDWQRRADRASLGDNLAALECQAVAWAVSAALAVAAGVALWLSARVDRLPASRLLRALAPSVAGSAVMGAGLWSLQRELRALAIAPSLFCLLGEIAFAVLLYGLYLKLCHRAIWQEASRWLRARVRRVPAELQDI